METKITITLNKDEMLNDLVRDFLDSGTSSIITGDLADVIKYAFELGRDSALNETENVYESGRDDGYDVGYVDGYEVGFAAGDADGE